MLNRSELIEKEKPVLEFARDFGVFMLVFTGIFLAVTGASIGYFYVTGGEQAVRDLLDLGRLGLRA